MANLLINTTVGGNAVITTSNIGTYALTSITSANVTTALGFTPYNATNPSGFITSSGSISGNAATATLASTVTINYNNDSNASYQLLWGSGNSVYGTANIYVNPNSDTIYASAYRGNANVGGTGEATYHPAGIFCNAVMWQYGDMYKSNTPIYNLGYLGMSGGNTTPIDIEGASHKYITIRPGNGYEAMVRYIGGSGSSWYVGKRTSGQLVGTESFHFYSEAAGATVGGINPSGDMIVTGSMRAPIFYDSQDTGYYLDPNGLSVLSHIRLNNNWANAGVNQGAINIRGQYPSMVFRNTVSDSMWLRHMDASGTIQHYYASDGVDSSNWSIKHSMLGNGNFSSVGTHTASQFNGSGAGLTGTASSLTAGSAGNVQGYSAYDLVVEARGMHSGSDFPNGTLVRTDINANVWAGNSFVMEVSGKSYGSGTPFKLAMEGYLYADSIINVSAMSYGSYFPGPVKVMRLDGILAFWWPRGSYWNSFQVHVRVADGESWNRVTSIGDSVDPAAADKKISITPVQVIHTNNIGSQSVSYATTAGSISGFNNPATGATANTIAYRDVNGDLTARELVITSGVQGITPTSLIGIFPTTNQAVKINATGVQAFLGLGSLAYSSATIPTNNNQLTNGAGYITGYTETDTLASVTARGASTSAAITVTASEGREVAVYMASSYTTNDLVSGHEYGWYNDHWRLGMTRSGGAAGEDFVIQWNAARRLSLTNGGNFTVTGTISASNFSGSSSGTNTGDQTNITGNAATATTAGSAGQVTHNAGRTDGTFYNVGWFASNPSPAYSCNAVQIQSSTGTLQSTNFVSNQIVVAYANITDTTNGSTWYGLGNAGNILGTGGNVIQLAGWYGVKIKTSSAEFNFYSNNAYYNGTLNSAVLQQAGNAVIHAGNIGSQSVSYATTAGALSSMNISQFTNNNGYITSSANVAGLNYTGLGNGTTNIDSGFSRVIRNENGLGGNPTYAPVLHLAAGDTMWQISAGHAGQTNLVWRSGYAGTWYTWHTIIHTGNFTDNSSNWNTAFSWGNHASAGYLTSITSGNVTTALGFTPYNSTNPSGFITSSGSISGNASTATILQTARTINGTSFNGSADIAIGRIYDTNFRRITNPGGGEFVTQASSVTGAIEIVFPNAAAFGMYRLVIKVYEYETNESFEVHTGGHTSSGTWHQPFAYIIGNPTNDRRFTVRFGRNAAGKAVVYIGEIGSTWSYPQVYLTEFTNGYTSFEDNSTGWAINFRTAAFENVTQTIGNCQVGYAVSTNTANSNVLRDGSGNFSAGTITATLTGNATTAGALTSMNISQFTNNSGYITSYTETNTFLGDGGSADTHPGTDRLIFTGQLSLGAPVLGMPSTDNSNSIININRHPGEYNSQLGFSSNGSMYYRSFSAVAINNALAWRQVWDSGNLTNLNQLTNGPAYITGYTETDTLASVTGRGATTASQVSFTKTDDHAISVGTIRGRAVGSQGGEFIQLYERVNIGGPSGWGAANTSAPSHGLSVYGGATIGYGNSGGLAVTGVLTVNTSGTGTWGPFVVTSTSLWGDGGTQYVTIGAGGAAGIMIFNPHVVWNSNSSTAAIRLGRSGGVSSGAYYEIGTGASDNFFIAKNAANGSPQFNINSSGNATFSGTIASGGNINVGGQLTFTPNEARLIAGSSTFAINNNANNLNLLMVHNSTGNVGIGTPTDSGFKLDVNGNTRSNDVIIGIDVTYGNPYRTVAFGNTGNGNNRILASTNNSDGMYFMAATGRGFYFRPNGGTADLVTITSTGAATFSGSVTATSFIGPLTGNATTATTAGSITNQANSATITASVSATANTIVLRDGNGYLFGNYINMSDDGNPGSGTAITSFITKQGDNYYRSVSPTNAMVSIRSVASGDWGINISGNAATATTAGSAGYSDYVAAQTNPIGNFNVGLSRPKGASYTTTASTVTGAIKIKLPAGVPVHGMWKMTVKIYEYGQRGNGYTIELGCHLYPSTAYNRYQWMLTTDTGAVLPIRYGTDGTSGCVWIGENGTVWSYPQIHVTEFSNGFNNPGGVNWTTGTWGVTIGAIDNSVAVDGPYTTSLIAASYATTAGTANAVAWTNVSSRPTALSQFTNDLGNYGGFLTSITAHTHAISDVTGLQTALDGKQASLGFTPYNSTNPSGYITSSASISGNAGSVTYLMNRTDSSAYPILWGANYTNGIGTIAYSCAAVTITSSTGTITANTFSGALSGNASTATFATTAGSAPANGGNSTTVGGYGVSTGVGANTVVIREANGYAFFNYINSNVSESENPTINSFYTSNGDGYFRKSTIAHVRSQLGNYGGFLTSLPSHTHSIADITSLQTALDGKQASGSYLTTSGKAADSELIDGIDSSRIVFGSGASKISSHSNANSQVNSGFYENDGGGSNWPSQAWYNSINVRHSNPGNYHGFQVAMSYYDNNLWFRSYQGSGTFQSWAYAISSQNIGSQSVSHASTAGSATTAVTADSANLLNRYSLLTSQDWNGWFFNAKMLVSSVSGHSGANRPVGTYEYGSTLSYVASGEDAFQMYFPENSINSGANARKLHYRSGWNGTWSGWRTVVDMVGDTCALSFGTSAKLKIQGSGGYGSPSNASVELLGDADGNQTRGYRFKTDAPDWNGQDLRIERYSDNFGYQLVGRIPKNTYNLEWQGTIVQGLSDERVKTNVSNMTDGIDKINQIRPVTFDWIPTENVSDRDDSDFGFIAQELEEILPEAVHTRGDGYKTVSYEKVVPVLVQAMKEQQAMIEALKAEVELLKNK